MYFGPSIQMWQGVATFEFRVRCSVLSVLLSTVSAFPQPLIASQKLYQLLCQFLLVSSTCAPKLPVEVTVPEGNSPNQWPSANREVSNAPKYQHRPHARYIKENS